MTLPQYRYFSLHSIMYRLGIQEEDVHHWHIQRTTQGVYVVVEYWDGEMLVTKRIKIAVTPAQVNA